MRQGALVSQGFDSPRLHFFLPSQPQPVPEPVREPEPEPDWKGWRTGEGWG